MIPPKAILDPRAHLNLISEILLSTDLQECCSVKDVCWEGLSAFPDSSEIMRSQKLTPIVLVLFHSRRRQTDTIETQ